MGKPISISSIRQIWSAADNDTNGNGVWDTGNYAEKRQPEMVYYYPMVLELKANFDLTQEWDIKAKPLDRQKPNELKNKTG